MAVLYKKIDDETLKKLHETEVEILDAIVNVCEKNNLTYFLVGGTALGAVRHKGFIPWDDDIDIAMPREDYEKFLEIGQVEIGKKYYIQSSKVEEDYWLAFTKVRKNGTTFANTWNMGKDTHNGVFVDIFPLDYTDNANSKLLNLNVTLLRNFVETLILKKGYYTKLSDLRHPFISALVLPFKSSTIHKIIYKLMTSRNNKKHNYLALLSGAYHYKKDIYPYDKVYPASTVTFEGKKYKSFNDIDFYLTQLYGDYMTLPPEEKRVNHAPEVVDFNNGIWLPEEEKND